MPTSDVAMDDNEHGPLAWKTEPRAVEVNAKSRTSLLPIQETL